MAVTVTVTEMLTPGSHTVDAEQATRPPHPPTVTKAYLPCS